MPDVDYLTKDSILPENQNYCVMSLFMSEDKKTIKYIRVSCSFKTVELAQEQTQLLKEPGHYNFVAETKTYSQIKCTQFGIVKIKTELNKIEE